MDKLLSYCKHIYFQNLFWMHSPTQCMCWILKPFSKQKRRRGECSNSSRFLKCFSQKLSQTVPSISITLFESFSKPAQAYLILRAGCADKKPLKWLFVFTIGRDCIFNSKYANIQSIPMYVHYSGGSILMLSEWIWDVFTALFSSKFEKHVYV